MVFTNLQSHEKDAFFSLLDEYFSSRPDIFANLASRGPSPTGARTPQEAAASAVGRAMANNPEATASIMSAGLRHVANSSRTGAGSSGGGGANTSGVSDNEATSVAGRVAAASMAFSASRNSQPPPSRMSPPPVAGEKPASHLVQTKKFGNVDTSSTMGFLGSLRNKPQAPPAPVAVPPAFPPKQKAYGPPPVRRAGSGAVSAARSPTPEPAPPPPPPARHQPEPEPERPAGEWAEALYDYQSDTAGDLELTEGQNVLVTERTSDDWWTGELNGKKGLFPASYVKLL